MRIIGKLTSLQKKHYLTNGVDQVSKSVRTSSLTYRSWEAMKYRRDVETSRQYPDYGGRGISYDPRWSSYDVFISDMGVRPSVLHTLDRIDNDKGYNKNNCRWATKQEQAFNRRKRKDSTSSYNNVCFNTKSSKWMARYLTTDGIRHYLGLFDSESEAVLAVRRFQDAQ